ncbi:unnamed protein product, partial [Rotaria sordida]
PFINLNDVQNENLLSLANQMKTELRRDNPDSNVLHKLWRQSFNTRRIHVRELPIDQLLEQHPGYPRADLLLAEVKESVGVDLNESVEVLLPKFFECLPDNNCFLSDVLPIRVIRILCKKFGESVGNVFTYQIDHVANQQSQQTQCSSLPKKLTTSNNTAQDSLNSINENDYDQTSDSADKNMFNHLSPISIPINNSQLNSSMILQNESQSSIDNQTFTDDLK